MAFLPYSEKPQGEAQAKLVEATCKTGDTKPTEGLLQGSLCIEIDNGKVYIFNGSSWVEQFSLQS